MPQLYVTKILLYFIPSISAISLLSCI
uniref:Uncharacterized protein n=1 Tax=Rhizophora mucronata TaxID=61149 RepID=A0A2P2IR28_RHIMU